MGLMAIKGITAEEYSDFLSNHDLKNVARCLRGENDNDWDYLYEPMTNANEKTLKIKVQMRGVVKPPMWREVLVPADFNFSQLHYAIQAVVGLDNCHLWQFERKPYDHGSFAIGIPTTDRFSFGIENCTFHADETPLTAFLANKGDKLVYVYDFKNDWIFNLTVSDVLDRQGDVAECRKHKSELQALDGYPSFFYQDVREYQSDPESFSKDDVKRLVNALAMDDREGLDAYIDDKLIDIEFVNEELADIPDLWEPIY